MSGRSFISSSSETDDLYSDNEIKKFVIKEGIKNSNVTELNIIANSMKSFTELDKSLKLISKTDDVNTNNDLINDICSKTESESQITFQSQDAISSYEKVNEEIKNINVNQKVDIFFDKNNASSQESVILKNEENIKKLNKQTKNQINTNFENDNYYNKTDLKKNIILDLSNINDNQIAINIFEEKKLKIQEILKKKIKFDLNSCIEKELDPEKIFLLVNSIKDELKKQFNNHKILVNVTIGENLSENFQMGFESDLNKFDSYGHFAFQNENIHLVATAYAVFF